MEQEKKYSPHDCPCRHCNEHRAGCHTIQCPHGWYQWNEAIVKRRDEINKKKAEKARYYLYRREVLLKARDRFSSQMQARKNRGEK